MAFEYVEGLRQWAAKGCVEEEGNIPLRPSSTMLKRVVRQKLCGHRHTIVPVDDIIQNVRMRLRVLL